MADRIVEVATPSSVAHVSQGGSALDEDRQLTATLSNMVAVLDTSSRATSQRPRDSSPHARSSRPSTPRQSRSSSPSSDLCWYRRHYGPNACKCRQPARTRERSGQSLAATSATGHPHSRLFFVRDRNSSLSFLVDTGAEVSVVPPSGSTNSRCHTGYALRAVNQSSIATYGTRSLTLDLGLRHTFRWVFIVADVQYAILGADFLHHFGLSVDVRQSLLLDTVTQLQIHGISTQTISASPSLPSLDSQDPYAAVLAEFPGILRPRPKEQPVRHTVTHHICTTGPPVSARPRHLFPDRLRIAKQEFDHMLDLGIVQPSSSCWATPTTHGPEKVPR